MTLAGAFGSASFPYLIGPAAHLFGFRVALALFAAPAAAIVFLSPYLRHSASQLAYEPTAIGNSS